MLTLIDEGQDPRSRGSVLRSWNYLFRLQLRLRLSKGFRSRAGSDFSFVGVCLHSIKTKMFSLFLRKKIDLIHLLDPIQYEL